MADQKLTPIFPGDVKPARPGVYLTHTPNPARYALWTGEVWLVQTRTPAIAQLQNRPAFYQSKRWQGLAKEPKHG